MSDGPCEVWGTIPGCPGLLRSTLSGTVVVAATREPIPEWATGLYVLPAPPRRWFPSLAWMPRQGPALAVIHLLAYVSCALALAPLVLVVALVWRLLDPRCNSKVYEMPWSEEMDRRLTDMQIHPERYMGL